MALTNAGKSSLAGLFGGGSTEPGHLYIAYGTGTTAFSASQTTLVTESQRELADTEYRSVVAPNDSIRYSYDFSISSDEDISEVGLFNDDTAGDMLCREIISPAESALTDGRAECIVDLYYKDGGFASGTGC